MSYELHAVIVNKNVTSAKPPALRVFEEARRISKNFIPLNRNFYRETTNSFRFRNIPKQQFEKGTFKSKKVNKDITLVYGKMKRI